MIGHRHPPGHPDALAPVVREHWHNVGKVGWWLMRPGLMAGMGVADLMGRHHGRHVTADASPRWSDAAGRVGGRGSIYLGTGTGSSYVSVPVHPENSLTRDWTYAIWVLRDTSLGGNQALFSRWLNSGVGRQIFIYVDASGVVKVDVPFIAAVIATNSGNWPVVMGRWNRVVVTRVGNVWSTYVDGNRAETATAAVTQETPTIPMEVGFCTAQGSAQLVGRWDDAALWNRGLSAAEVRADHELSRAGYPGALRSWASSTPRLDPAGAVTYHAGAAVSPDSGGPIYYAF